MVRKWALEFNEREGKRDMRLQTDGQLSLQDLPDLGLRQRAVTVQVNHPKPAHRVGVE